MKRLLPFIWMFALMCGLVFAGGKDAIEEVEPVELVVIGAGAGIYHDWIAAFKAENPGVEVLNVNANIKSASTITMETLFAAGDPPNLYNDFTGRSSKYMVTGDEFKKWKALPLNDYIDDLDDYYPDIINAVTINGQVLGLPQSTPAQAFGVNLDMMADAGYEVPERWTIDDFLEMCEAVKKNLPDKFPTALFAANPSGDYIWMNWFGAFGAKMYADGDYSKTIINSPEGLSTFRFWKMLMDKGYIPEESGMLTDDDYVLLFAGEAIASGGFRPDWVTYYVPQAIKQGLLDEPFNVKMVPFPRGPGVDNSPSLGTGNTVVVRDTGDEKINKLASRLAWYFTNTRAQIDSTVSASFPTRKSVPPSPATASDPLWSQTKGVVSAGGFFDVGYAMPDYYETRAAGFPILQALLAGDLTPEEAIKKYADTINEILK